MKTLAIKMAGPFHATSRADGTILVTPEWHPAIANGGAGLAGVFARIELAEEIEDRLNALHKKLGKRARATARRRVHRAEPPPP